MAVTKKKILQSLARVTSEPGSRAPSDFELQLRVANLERLLDETVTDADLDRAIDQLLRDGKAAQAGAGQIARAANTRESWREHRHQELMAEFCPTSPDGRPLTREQRNHFSQIFGSIWKTHDDHDHTQMLADAAEATELFEMYHPRSTWGN